MNAIADRNLDVMQVCRNGHVITDRLHGNPSSGRTHCDRCGAATLERCLTCGHALPGALEVPGLVPIGARPAPRHCLVCGAPFPWVRQAPARDEPLAVLATFLRRLPLVIRQLRWRHADRPPLRIEDERDLEDLIRALLPLHFDDVRLENRTPMYSSVTRTDIKLATDRIALTMKYARPGFSEPMLVEQWQEDIAYYQRSDCGALVCYIYDPEGLLRDVSALEARWTDLADTPHRHWIIGTPSVDQASAPA